MLSRLSRLFAQSLARRKPLYNVRCRPIVEILEERLSPAVFTVTNTLDNGGVNPAPGAGTGTLRQAIIDSNAASSNDTIVFAIANGSTITLAAALPAIASAATSGSLTITGLGSTNLTVSGANNFRVFANAANAISTITGLTISNGKASYPGGGGILNIGSLTLTDVAVKNTQNPVGYNGTAILNQATGTIVGTSVTISGNTMAGGGGSGGGLFNNGGSVALTNSIITGNTTNGGSGAGVFNQTGMFTATNTQITNNKINAGNYGAGGGLFLNGGTVTLLYCTVSQNYSRNSGGGIFSRSTTALSMTGGAVSNNSTRIGNYIGGGGLSVNTSSSATLNGVAIQNNVTAENGGGIDSNALLSLTNCIISGNSLAETNRSLNGGGIHIGSGSATLTGCVIEKNTITKSGTAGDGFGGGISDGSGSLTISGCSILGNTISSTTPQSYGGDDGGGLVTSAATTITNSVISGNSVTNLAGGAVRGGGIEANNILNLINVGIGVSVADPLGGAPFAGNQIIEAAATTNNYGSGGGGIWFQGGTAVWNYITVMGNSVSDGAAGASSAHDGGGIRLNTGSPVTISNSTISGNTAGSRGGGILATGLLTINNSTISGNTSGGTTNFAAGYNADGGGIWTNGSLYLNNCTVANNVTTGTAGPNVGGAAIFFQGARDVLVNCTISGNAATVGTGALSHSYNPNTILINTLVAGNTGGADPDISDQNGPFNVAASFNNLIGNGTGATFVNGTNGNQVGSAGTPIIPRLGSLLNNGGPTATMALLAGSPAIDAGNNSNSPGATDERGTGFNRIINGTIDIGAYEFQPPATITTIVSSLNPSQNGQGLTFTATVAGTAAGSNTPEGTVTFLDGSTPLGIETLVNGSASFSTASLTVGSHTITAQYNGFTVGNFTFTGSSAALRQLVNAVPPPPPPPPPSPPPVIPINYVAIGADAGGGPQVVVYNSATNAVVSVFFAFTPTFTGGVRVAVDDINGDGVPDIICAAGPGGGPEVEVIDGTKLSQMQSNGQIANSALLATFNAFNAPTFTGGVFVAAGAASSGQNWVVVGAGAGGGPQVTVYTAKAIVAAGVGGTPASIANFFAFAPTFTGGVSVAVGDTAGTGKLNVIVGAGAGGGPQVIVVDGTKFAQVQSNGQIANSAVLANFFAFAPSFTGGVFVSGGLFAGQYNLIVGAGPGGGPQVLAINGSQLSQLQSNGQIANSAILDSFFALPSGFTGGVRVGFDSNFGTPSRAAILIMAGPGGSPEGNIFDALTQKSVAAFFFLPASFTGGAFISG
jgi:hypothetical protein